MDNTEMLRRNRMKTFTITQVKGFHWSKPGELVIASDGECSDEYHSMHELYQHRMALNIALFHAYAEFCIKSKLHSDGTMFENYFIVTMEHPEMGQISYHYQIKHWNKFRIPEVERAPTYDGHNSSNVLERLMK